MSEAHSSPVANMISFYVQLRSQVKRGVAIICKIRIAEMLRVVFDDALQQHQIVEMNGASDPCGNIDPSFTMNKVHVYRRADRDSTHILGIICSKLELLDMK